MDFVLNHGAPHGQFHGVSSSVGLDQNQIATFATGTHGFYFAQKSD
jgi:hypothetical protein